MPLRHHEVQNFNLPLDWKSEILALAVCRAPAPPGPDPAVHWNDSDEPIFQI